MTLMKPEMLQTLTHYLLKIVFVVVLIFAVFRFAGPIPVSVNTKNLGENSTFFVSAEGSVFVQPDTAVISFSVNKTASTASRAQSDANATAKKIADEIKKLGVSEDNIKTTSYNIFPTYDQQSYTRIVGYRADISMQIKDTDLDRVNKVVDTAVANGADQVSGITFEVGDLDNATDEARELAIDKAKEKADKIADVAGIRLGKKLNVTEYSPEPYPMYEKAMLDSGGGSTSTDLEPGQTEVTVSVTLSYETY